MTFVIRSVRDEALRVTPAAAISRIMGRKVRTDVVREHWGDILRLVASLKSGHAAPSVMMRKLAAYERQNRLDIALQEVGKIERTLFMLDWLESPELRRRCQAGLNRGEQRHAMAQAICTFRPDVANVALGWRRTTGDRRTRATATAAQSPSRSRRTRN